VKKTNNPVAKHARTFNKAVVMKDRKKAEKKGDRKHKGKYKEDTDVVEDKKGLWDRIRAKRKRGEAPAKPGDKDYPKTLDVGEEVEQVDEVSSKKLDSYLKKSRVDKVKQYAKLTGKALTKDVGGPEVKKQLYKMNRRELGNLRAKERLNREEVEQVEEGNLQEVSTEKLTRALEGRVKELKRVKDQEDKVWDKIIAAEKSGKPTKPLHKESDKLVDKMADIRDSIVKLQSKIKHGKDVIATPQVRQRKLYGKAFGEEVEQVDEAKAPSTVKFKGKTYYQTGKTGKDAKTGAPSFEYSSDMDGDDERVFYNAKTKKITRESVQVDEEMSAVERRKHLNLKKRAKQGNSQAKIRLKKFEDKFKDDLEADKRSAKQSTKKIRGSGAADPESGVQFTGKGSGAGEDDNLIMQLRKAQDVDGKMDIKVSATGKSVRIPKALIDKLLAAYDRASKPEDKRKFKLLVTKELRKKAK